MTEKCNPDTLVAVNCYQGDAWLLKAFFPEYLHHGCPVLVLSPEDSKVEVVHDGVESLSAGLAGWKGPQTVARTIVYWKIIAERSERWVLLHDTDSVCLTPELPDYLYEDPDVLWSNEIGDGAEKNFLPPYFMSTDTLRRMVKATEEDPSDRARELARAATSGDPFEGGWEGCDAPDALYVAVAAQLGLEHRSYPDGSTPWHPNWPAEENNVASDVANRGARMIHGAKDRGTLDILKWAYDFAWKELVLGVTD